METNVNFQIERKRETQITWIMLSQQTEHVFYTRLDPNQTKPKQKKTAETEAAVGSRAEQRMYALNG